MAGGMFTLNGDGAEDISFHALISDSIAHCSWQWERWSFGDIVVEWSRHQWKKCKNYLVRNKKGEAKKRERERECIGIYDIIHLWTHQLSPTRMMCDFCFLSLLFFVSHLCCWIFFFLSILYTCYFFSFKWEHTAISNFFFQGVCFLITFFVEMEMGKLRKLWWVVGVKRRNYWRFSSELFHKISHHTGCMK